MLVSPDQVFLWPYDEIKCSRGAKGNRFLFSAPWLEISIEIDPAQAVRAGQLLDKLNSGEIAPSDLADISWLFAVLAKYPMTYYLPRSEWPRNLDRHVMRGGALTLPPLSEFFAQERKWDQAVALQFAKTSDGVDPRAFFSVLRRYHLLDAVESNRTAELYTYVRGLKAQKDKFAQACAWIVRQNHYVTQRCEGSLRPAVKTAQGASDLVAEFINAEAGHDQILAKALATLPNDKVEVLPAVVLLMDLLRLAAEKNFLAFSTLVDFFERSAYAEKDPLAELLEEGGLEDAAKQINVHKGINDAGGHESVALGFVNTMAAVDEQYAAEALQMVEIATMAVHDISRALLQRIQAF